LIHVLRVNIIYNNIISSQCNNLNIDTSFEVQIEYMVGEFVNDINK